MFPKYFSRSAWRSLLQRQRRLKRHAPHGDARPILRKMQGREDQSLTNHRPSPLRCSRRAVHGLVSLRMRKIDRLAEEHPVDRAPKTALERDEIVATFEYQRHSP